MKTKQIANKRKIEPVAANVNAERTVWNDSDV